MIAYKIVVQLKLVVFVFLIVNLPYFLKAQSAMPTVEKIENSFTKETISPVQFKAFHQRAKQKLQDFADLIAIISDPDYDLSLRKASLPMALRLFESEASRIKYYDYDKRQVESTTIITYLDSLLESKIKIQFDFRILSKEDASQVQYTWPIEFLQTQKSDNSNYPSLKAKINIVLLQKEKKFGAQTKYIWEVLLGDIEEVVLVSP